MPVEPDAFDHGRAHCGKDLFRHLQVIIDLAGMVTDGQRFCTGIILISGDNGGWHSYSSLSASSGCSLRYSLAFFMPVAMAMPSSPLSLMISFAISTALARSFGGWFS